jgi:hypothetical protein
MKGYLPLELLLRSKYRKKYMVFHPIISVSNCNTVYCNQIADQKTKRVFRLLSKQTINYETFTGLSGGFLPQIYFLCPLQPNACLSA